jgi:broad specificity phosphatase PhoE
MKILASILAIILVHTSQLTQAQQHSLTTFILVRHAEKSNDGTDNPALKPEGLERARRLAAMFSASDIHAIFSTNYKRTTQTAEPLAAVKGLEIQIYEPFKPDVIESMLSKYRGSTIVVVGHSNNIPWIANLLIGKDNYKIFDDNEYGTILIVTVEEKEKQAKVLKVNY